MNKNIIEKAKISIYSKKEFENCFTVDVISYSWDRWGINRRYW